MFTYRNAFGMSSWEHILETYNSLFMNEVKLHGIFGVTFCENVEKTDHFS